MSELIVDIGDVSSPTPSVSDQTVADIVQATLKHLRTGTRVERDKLDGAVSADAATLTTTVLASFVGIAAPDCARRPESWRSRCV